MLTTKKNNITHLIMVPFTGVGKTPYKSDEWFKDRIEIFKKYTLKSLLNQTNKNFILWLSFRPEEEFNPLILDLIDHIVRNGVEVVVTYNGLMYWDDRNEEANKTLKERLKKSLDQIYGRFIQFQDYQTESKWGSVYLTRIDSDDMFHRVVVDLIQNEPVDIDCDYPFEGALTLHLGYVYNKDTGEVAEWNPLTNPPFHTIIMERATFFDPKLHLEAYQGFQSHEDIARLKHIQLWRGNNRRDRLYCVLTHNPQMHISTTWNHEFKGKLVDPKVLKEFGI